MIIVHLFGDVQAEQNKVQILSRKTRIPLFAVWVSEYAA